VDPLVLDLGRYERGLREQGFRLIAGVDEAGRGALAGPLVAAAVILPVEFDLEGINDSKVLTALQRDAAFERIVGHAVARSVCRCMPTRIDRRGLHKTNVWLLRRCITTLSVAPDYVLTDGFPVKRLGIPNLSIKKGDAVTASVAAASIVAKVTRDRMMDRYHRRFLWVRPQPRVWDRRAPRGDQAPRPVADPSVLVQGPADRLLRRR
jgi:ribonuclease HII